MKAQNILKILTIVFLYAVLCFCSGDEQYLVVASEMPQPVGGLAGLHKNITYPDAARQMKMEGKVFLMAYINENGGVDDVKVLKGVNEVLDNAAIEGVKKAKFSSGKNNNIPVKVKLALTITFKL